MYTAKNLYFLSAAYASIRFALRAAALCNLRRLRSSFGFGCSNIRSSDRRLERRRYIAQFFGRLQTIKCIFVSVSSVFARVKKKISQKKTSIKKYTWRNVDTVDNRCCGPLEEAHRFDDLQRAVCCVERRRRRFRRRRVVGDDRCVVAHRLCVRNVECYRRRQRLQTTTTCSTFLIELEDCRSYFIATDVTQRAAATANKTRPNLTLRRLNDRARIAYYERRGRRRDDDVFRVTIIVEKRGVDRMRVCKRRRRVYSEILPLRKTN